MELQLDGETHQQGHSILAQILVTNRSGKVFRDLAYMDPGAGYLRLFVEHEGIALSRRGYHDTILFLEEGPPLESGGCACEVLDLTKWFEPPGNSQSSQKLMPIGTYVAWAELRANLGVYKGQGTTRLKSEPVTFHIAGSQADTSQVREAENRYRELPVRGDTLVSALHVDDRGPVLNAAVLDLSLRASLQGDRAKLRWIERLRSGIRSKNEACVLDTWDRKLRTRKHYVSMGE